ncbi:MAG TPA: hypothetical protein DDZ83_10515 [Nitrospinae bacterium]|nr:hypothetical protein [Nitrospinota bacterium]
MKSLSARLRAPDENIQVLETDVLVIGGGVAGCLAAIGAAEAGAKCVICEKGGIIERSGSIAGGVDHFFAVLEEGPEWDTPEYLLRHIPAITEGVVDLDVCARFLHGIKGMVQRLEKMGIDFHNPAAPGRPYLRHRSFGLPGEYTIEFEGNDFKQVIGQAARHTGARTLERVMVSEILMDEEGHPRGCVAFHIRHGTIYAVLARAVVLATGETNRLARNASGYPYDSWHIPYNTGDGQAMALRIGACLANMEFTDATITPKGYSTQGTNGFVGAGAYLVNALGERFMFRYHPAGEKARRIDLINGVINETAEGRGPVYIDCRHLPEEDVNRLKSTLGVDRPAMPAFFEQKGIDLGKDLLEITVSEMSSRGGGVVFRRAGVRIDPDCVSNIPGLFAAGDCSTVSNGIAGATVMGHIAGGSAARYALSRSRPEPLSKEDIGRIREELVKPLAREGDYDPRQFEDEVRSIVTDNIGFRRNETRLKEALRQLGELQGREGAIGARDFHDLMRLHEARNLRTVAETIAASALERRETRGGGAHVRMDYPERDDASGLRTIMVEKENGGLRILSEPTGLTAEKPAASKDSAEATPAMGGK